jgi:hypothetical protein
MKVSLHNILLKSANSFLRKGIQPGHNGPYKDSETVIRANSHLAMLYLKCFEISGKGIYKKAATECLEVLFSKTARPHGYSFHHRNKKGKDKCNGLIGQAWCIEALMEGFRVLKDEKYKELAKEVFFLHEFNDKFGYWKRREIDGNILFYDKTFNHQLWFAACGSLIPEAEYQVKKFLDKLEDNISIHKNGKIRHLVFAKYSTPIYFVKDRKITRKYLGEKETGYHAFNLYALGLLKKAFPSHSFWKSKKFKKIIDYTFSKEHIIISQSNKYGFAYNPSGIEVAFFASVFELDKRIIQKSLEKQFKSHLNESFLMENRTSDPNNLSLRIYEAVRVNNMDLEI